MSDNVSPLFALIGIMSNHIKWKGEKSFGSDQGSTYNYLGGSIYASNLS